MFGQCESKIATPVDLFSSCLLAILSFCGETCISNFPLHDLCMWDCHCTWHRLDGMDVFARLTVEEFLVDFYESIQWCSDPKKKPCMEKKEFSTLLWGSNAIYEVLRSGRSCDTRE